MLVTGGAAGFIGFRLANRLLAEGAYVVAVDDVNRLLRGLPPRRRACASSCASRRWLS